MISVIGLIGAVRHHQVLLFFYMVVLFLIFLIQFSCSCAALAIDEMDEKKLIKSVSFIFSFVCLYFMELYNVQAWNKAETNSPSLVAQAEQVFDCCGVGLNEEYELYMKPNAHDMNFTDVHNVFENYPKAECYHEKNQTISEDCRTCYSHISDKVWKVKQFHQTKYLMAETANAVDTSPNPWAKVLN